MTPGSPRAAGLYPRVNVLARISARRSPSVLSEFWRRNRAERGLVAGLGRVSLSSTGRASGRHYLRRSRSIRRALPTVGEDQDWHDAQEVLSQMDSTEVWAPENGGRDSPFSDSPSPGIIVRCDGSDWRGVGLGVLCIDGVCGLVGVVRRHMRPLKAAAGIAQCLCRVPVIPSHLHLRTPSLLRTV